MSDPPLPSLDSDLNLSRLNRLLWASEVLRRWSRPEYLQLPGSPEIRALARLILSEERQQVDKSQPLLVLSENPAP